MAHDGAPAPAVLAAAQARSQAAAKQWLAGDAHRALEARFAGLDDHAVADAAQRAHALLADDRWAADLLAPLTDHLRRDPWFEPPLRVSRDALRTGAVLFDCPALSITATLLSADALAALPPPATVVVPGRLSLVRFVRGGSARLKLWRAERIGGDFSADEAKPCAPLGELPLGDGVVLRLDGRTRGWLIEDAQADVMMLTATIRARAAPFMREFDIGTGALVRTATLDDGASRALMLLTLLRLQRRADAAPAFDAATRDGAFFLRWAAMREWLALDARGAVARLREMAAGDRHAEVRAAAAATLAMVERRLATGRCPA